MKKLRIGYFADGPWSHEAFKLLVDCNWVEFAFIVPRFDTKDETLVTFAKEHSIDYLKFKNVNHDDSIEKIKTYECDLLVSMSFNQIFKKKLIELTPHGIVNVHAGNLPFYRGRNILNWALINDESSYGITMHYVDEGIDTGDIILQKQYDINDDDTYKTLLENAYSECAVILLEGLQSISNNTAKRIPQNTIHPIGFYCGRRREGDEILNWNQSSRDIFNFVRAICDPGPRARAFLNGKEMKIQRVIEFKDVPQYKGHIGQILSKTKDGFLVKTMDTFIEVVEYEYSNKIRVGDRFTIK